MVFDDLRFYPNFELDTSFREYQTSSSESESEDLVSVKKRPLKVAAKKKAKVSGLRERKKREKNASST
ncbi:hypothetical protein TNCV_2465061 [Trichonephila clavipes]|uniref:Uncharacterized protein n=1 Tax=Trichonephila clavipes TaxID=2585209 RepID=A0A8X6UTZ5_TRICX|nr:hypothetical protein TNCV_2465061 [Trichonephila clavipes]